MRQSLFWVLLATSLATGCDEPSVLTVINGAHHGERVDGVLPNYGDPDKARVFTNDKGWTITLSEGVVVTTAAALETCTGERIEVGTPFGPYPESFSEMDQNATDFGHVDLAADTYCQLSLTYGAYSASAAGMAEDTPFPVGNAANLEGRTLLLVGYAEKTDGAGVSVLQNFLFETSETVQVDLDLGKLASNGGPFKVTGDENATPNLTVLKTYDALFKGIDFADFDPVEINRSLGARLSDNTRVIAGNSIY